MGKADSYTKEFMKDNHIFAEVYNFLLGKYKTAGVKYSGGFSHTVAL